MDLMDPAARQALDEERSGLEDHYGAFGTICWTISGQYLLRADLKWSELTRSEAK